MHLALAQAHPHASVRIMTYSSKTLRLLASASLAAVIMLTLDSCSSSHGIKGIPQTLPSVAVSGSNNTPPHHMASYEYPFDSNGRYVTDWAAEGERRAGRSAAAAPSDTQKWSGSHGGSSSTKSRSSTGTKAKSSTASKSSGGSGTTYIVKQGDTLSHIAVRYGTTVTKIKNTNGLSSTNLRIGQKLRIPRKA